MVNWISPCGDLTADGHLIIISQSSLDPSGNTSTSSNQLNAFFPWEIGHVTIFNRIDCVRGVERYSDDAFLGRSVEKSSEWRHEMLWRLLRPDVGLLPPQRASRTNWWDFLYFAFIHGVLSKFLRILESFWDCFTFTFSLFFLVQLHWFHPTRQTIIAVTIYLSVRKDTSSRSGRMFPLKKNNSEDSV